MFYKAIAAKILMSLLKNPAFKKYSKFLNLGMVYMLYQEIPAEQRHAFQQKLQERLSNFLKKKA